MLVSFFMYEKIFKKLAKREIRDKLILIPQILQSMHIRNHHKALGKISDEKTAWI